MQITENLYFNDRHGVISYLNSEFKQSGNINIFYSLKSVTLSVSKILTVAKRKTNYCHKYVA